MLRVEVNVTNSLTHNGTSIHWHVSGLWISLQKHMYSAESFSDITA